MDLSFDCPCGATTSVLARSSNGEVNFQMQCDECESVFAVTVTPLSQHPA